MVSLQKGQKNCNLRFKLALAEHKNTEKVALKYLLLPMRLTLYFMETERSLLLSQQTKICLCPRPQESGSHLYIPHFNLALPFTFISYKLLFSSRFHPKPLQAFLLPNMLHMRHPSDLICCNHPNNTGWGEKIIKLNIMYFPPSSCYLLSRKANSFLSNLFSNPQSTSCHQYYSPRFTPIRINRRSYSSVYFNLRIFIYQMGRQKRPPDIQDSCEYTEWTKNSSSVGVGPEINNTRP